MSYFRDVLDDIKDNLSDANHSTIVSPDQIHNLIIANYRMVDLIERLYNRLVDLETVQNERSEG